MGTLLLSCIKLLFELTYIWMIQYLHYSDFPEELLRHRGTFNASKNRSNDITCSDPECPLCLCSGRKCYQALIRELSEGNGATINSKAPKCLYI